MRTTIDIDDVLLRKAMRLTGNRTKKATVEMGLRLLIDVQGQATIRQLRGKVRWEGEETGKGATPVVPRNSRKGGGFSLYGPHPKYPKQLK